MRLDVPAVVGVPLIAPLEKVSPAGNVPPVRANVYGDVPPEAASVWENATPTVAERLPVVMLNGVPPAAMVMEYCLCALWLAESVTEVVKRNDPAAVGVPLIAPVEAFNCRPPGSAPEAIDHV